MVQPFWASSKPNAELRLNQVVDLEEKTRALVQGRGWWGNVDLKRGDMYGISRLFYHILPSLWYVWYI